MDLSLKLFFDEFNRKLDELEARSEQRWAALEQRGAAVASRIVVLEQSYTTEVVVADNWGGLFDEIPASSCEHVPAFDALPISAAATVATSTTALQEIECEEISPADNQSQIGGVEKPPPCTSASSPIVLDVARVFPTVVAAAGCSIDLVTSPRVSFLTIPKYIFADQIRCDDDEEEYRRLGHLAFAMRTSAAYPSPFVVPGGDFFHCAITTSDSERDVRVLAEEAAPDPADIDAEGYASANSTHPGPLQCVRFTCCFMVMDEHRDRPRFRLGRDEHALCSTLLGGNDGSLDDGPASCFTHFYAPLHLAVGRLGQALAAAAALRADAVGAAGGGQLAWVAAAGSSLLVPSHSAATWPRCSLLPTNEYGVSHTLPTRCSMLCLYQTTYVLVSATSSFCNTFVQELNISRG